MEEAPPVRMVDLGRRFGPVEAVRGLSLEIREGETFGLLGPNGAGKTSTLSMLSTLLPPSEGDAWIFGRSLTGPVAEVRRLVGLAPQEISLYPDLDGEENLHFFGRIHGVRGRQLRERARHLLDLVGLTPRRQDRVRSYSGGMKRRLNFACSLIHEPRLLLLDEPTAGVDPQSRKNLFSAVQAIAASGTTVIFTTHYMEEAEKLCDRIAIMDEGRVVAVGSLWELLEIVGMGEVIEVRVAAQAIEDSRLAAIPDVSRFEWEGDVLRVFTTSAVRVLGPVSAALAESGATVDGIQIHRVDLERVFIHLTGKELRD
jgi:ABC-2 type transport system ATP-binding protein